MDGFIFHTMKMTTNIRFLFFSILLVVSSGCATHRVSNAHDEAHLSVTERLDESSAMIDTTRTIWAENVEFNKVIHETITTREYDTEKEGNPLCKETTTEREVVEDHHKGVQKEEESGLSNNISKDVNKDILSDRVDIEETKKEDGRVKWIAVCFISVALIFAFRFLSRLIRK